MSVLGGNMDNSSSLLQAIKDGRKALMKCGVKPKQMRMTMETFYSLVQEITGDSCIDYLPAKPTYDRTGKQIRIGRVNGMDIYIDDSLPAGQIIEGE